MGRCPGTSRSRSTVEVPLFLVGCTVGTVCAVLTKTALDPSPVAGKPRNEVENVFDGIPHTDKG